MEMLQILISILFGIVEGITEWIPVSSTGHMILLEEFVKFDLSRDFLEMYLVVIQFGAILAVVILYFKDLWPFCKDKEKHYIQNDKMSMWFKIVVSCIPAVIVELAAGDFLEDKFYNFVCVAVMLIIVGVVFVIVEVMNKDHKPTVNEIKDITYRNAFIIGIFQVIAAAFPGTSRSGATIIGGLILGLSRTVAAEYTFFMAVPVMFGASVMKMLKFGFNYTPMEAVVLIVGCIVAFVVSLVVIKFFMGYIKKHDFKVFGYYRIVLGIIVLLYFLLR
ncbi:MAG: undecaprenyl-diphosphate phosphatase [Lachnospiraceae bacterium]|nr:undecaprenyl-diphosphate phosphatase [Lachnospiraceae bacterium]